uniref:Uncharacterized protein n=1 Tax=Glossina palpalis gambiensis TaxID=67801 RepID=A0A1B0BVR3_9MUSC
MDEARDRICEGRGRDLSRMIGILIGFLLAIPHFFQTFFSPFASDSRGDSRPTRADSYARNTSPGGKESPGGGSLRGHCIIMDCNIAGVE